MNSEEINYDAFLWPLPYQREALQRAQSLREAHRDLAALYEFVFDPENVRLPVIPQPIPFSREVVDPDHSASRYFDHRPELPLSIVTVSRNDDHVEHMAERTQAFIDCLYCLAEKFQRPLELIIVEWNPPADRLGMQQAFRFPRKHPYVSTEIVTVPRELHQTYNLAEQLPLYQMIGKNVGIRRARGEFILSTNIDVLLSEELFEYITGDKLRKGQLYRGNRWDVDRKILELGSPNAMIANARELTFQINYPHATVAIDAQVPQEAPLVDYIGFRQLPPVHTMACGDFQLLHRDDWARLRGFCELDTFSFHIDSLFTITCHHAGLKEFNLGNEFPHYHIDHTLGTSVKNDSYVIDNNKVMKHISIAGLINLSRNMETEGDCYIFNKPNWGMAGIDLPIANTTIADWESSPYQPLPPLTDTGKGCLEALSLDTVNIDGKQNQQKHELLQTIANATAAYLRSHFAERSVCIWGAGQRARILAHFLSEQDFQIDGFFDGTISTTPDSKRAADILDIDRLQHRETNVFVLICSMHADEIVQRLKQWDLVEGEDYLVAY